MWSRSSRFWRGLRELLPADETTELSRVSRAGVISERGIGGGFMRASEVGVEAALSCCWLLGGGWPCWLPGRALLLEGVEGGRIGVGWRLTVGAIAGTSLNVWKADGMGSFSIKLRL